MGIRLTAPPEFGKARFYARQGTEWIVAADSLDVLLLRLRGVRFDSIYERGDGKRVDRVANVTVKAAIGELRGEGYRGWTLDDVDDPYRPRADRDAEAVIAMTLATWHGSGLDEQRLLAERIAEALRVDGLLASGAS